MQLTEAKFGRHPPGNIRHWWIVATVSKWAAQLKATKQGDRVWTAKMQLGCERVKGKLLPARAWTKSLTAHCLTLSVRVVEGTKVPICSTLEYQFFRLILAKWEWLQNHFCYASIFKPKIQVQYNSTRKVPNKDLCAKKVGKKSN